MIRKKDDERVLVVDDNKHMARCLAEMISIMDIECKTAFEGQQAIELLKRQGYMLVIADSNMPSISGFSLLKYIKEKYPETKVAIMSLRDSESTQGFAARGGADYYLPKPFKTEDIEALLKEVFV